jgi:hypothetical protein
LAGIMMMPRTRGIKYLIFIHLIVMLHHKLWRFTNV